MYISSIPFSPMPLWSGLVVVFTSVHSETLIVGKTSLTRLLAECRQRFMSSTLNVSPSIMLLGTVYLVL